MRSRRKPISSWTERELEQALVVAYVRVDPNEGMEQYMAPDALRRASLVLRQDVDQLPEDLRDLPVPPYFAWCLDEGLGAIHAIHDVHCRVYEDQRTALDDVTKWTGGIFGSKPDEVPLARFPLTDVVLWTLSSGPPAYVKQTKLWNFEWDGPIKSAIWDLGLVGDRVTYESILSAAKSKDKAIRVQGVAALGELGDDRAIEPLGEAVSDRKAQVRGAAVRALGTFKNPRSIDLLCAALDDKDKDVRGSAAYSLGKLGDATAVGPLCKALSVSDRDMQTSVILALKRIGDGEAAQPLLEYVRQQASDPVSGAYSAANALANCGAQGVDALLEALNDKNPDVRWLAATAFSSDRPTKAIRYKRVIRALGASIADDEAMKKGDAGGDALLATPDRLVACIAPAPVRRKSER